MLELAENILIESEFGYCSFDIDSSEFAIIHGLYIYEEFRKQGYGRELLEFVVERIRQCGYKGDIYIQAIPKENSISKEKLELFYESLGLCLLVD